MELKPIKDGEIRCGACLQGFIPRDGLVNVVREKWDDPGAPVCPECFGRLASRNLIAPDENKFKCTCGSLDPTRLPCRVHTNLHPEVGHRVM